MTKTWTAKAGFYFVLLFGLVNLFADFAYEGARSVSGPFLLSLGASGLVAGAVGGSGELLGYALRLVSGRWADESRRYWLITGAGYLVQMLAVPALALAGNWQMAALLILLERVGKAIRNPPRDVMLSEAGEHMGRGWAFGVNEALDQLGAFMGPLAVAGVYALRHDYHAAFAWLALPAMAVLLLVLMAKFAFPQSGHVAKKARGAAVRHYSSRFGWYAAGAALVGFGFSDYALIAYHLAKTHPLPQAWIPVIYALAMGAGGIGALAIGRWYDRAGLRVLLPITLITALFAPLVFLGGQAAVIVGVMLWGLGLSAHESVMQAAVADMVPAQSRGRAYGLFTAIFGVSWFAGSVLQGALYDRSIMALVVVGMIAQLAAIIPILIAARD